MAFIEDIIFPVNISRGSRGGPGFNHDVFESDSGEKHVVSRWPRELRSWNARWGVRTFDHLREVHDLYLVVNGMSNGFRFRDPFDHATTASGIIASDQPAVTNADASLGTGDGSNRIFQIQKQYTVGTTTHNRAIEKPIDGTLLVAVAGVAQTETTDYTVDYSTGTIQFTVGSTPDVGEAVTAGCQFHVPVQFGAEIDRLLEIDINGWRSGAIPDIPLVEMVGNVATPQQPYGGGGSTQIISIDTAFDYAMGHGVTFVPQSGGLFVMLPEIADLAAGPLIFQFHNGDSTNSLDFRAREDGSLAFTLAADTGAMVGIRLTGTVKNWIAYGATVTT